MSQASRIRSLRESLGLPRPRGFTFLEPSEEAVEAARAAAEAAERVDD